MRHDAANRRRPSTRILWEVACAFVAFWILDAAVLSTWEWLGEDRARRWALAIAALVILAVVRPVVGALGGRRPATTEDEAERLGLLPTIIVVFAVGGLGCCALCAAWQADRAWLSLHTTVFYCAQEPKDLVGGRILRVLAVVVGLICLGLAPVAGRWARRRPLDEIVSTSLNLLTAVVLACVVSEAWMRRKPLPPPPHITALYPSANPDRDLDWRNIPSRTYWTTANAKPFAYHINAQGFRTRHVEDIVDTTKPAILFAGESISMGAAVDYDETYATLVGERLGVQPVLIGGVGYGNTQAHRLTIETLAKFTKPVAVVTLVIRDEVPRELHDPMLFPAWPHLRVARDGTLVPAEPPPRFWQESRLRKLLGDVMPHDNEAIEITRAIFRATTRAARERGAIPLFVFTNFGPGCMPDGSGRPSLEGVLFPDDEVPHIGVPLDPSWHPVDDSHPDARSHRLLAERIEQALRKLGLEHGQGMR